MRLSKVVLCVFVNLFLLPLCMANDSVGIGVRLQEPMRNNPEVFKVFQGGGASDAGVLPKDLIVEIDGVSTSGLNYGQVVEKLKGQEGTVVAIKIRRNDAPMDIKITRKKFDLPCKDDYSMVNSKLHDHGGVAGIGTIMDNESDFAYAKWAITYLDRCPVNDKSSFDDRVLQSHRKNIEAKIEKFAPKFAALKELKDKCPNFDSCKQKQMYDTQLGNWYMHTPEQLKTSLASSSGEEGETPYKFSLECACYVNSAPALKDDSDMAVLYHNKWAAAEKEKAEEKKARAEEKAIAATERKQENERLGKMQSTKECKVAKSARNFCKLSAVARTLELKINHEKKVGEQSGFVNAALLRNTTSTKISVEDEAAKEKANYKQLTGSGITVASCELLDDYPRESRLPKSYLENEKKACGSVEDGEE